MGPPLPRSLRFVNFQVERLGLAQRSGRRHGADRCFLPLPQPGDDGTAGVLVRCAKSRPARVSHPREIRAETTDAQPHVAFCWPSLSEEQFFPCSLEPYSLPVDALHDLSS